MASHRILIVDDEEDVLAAWGKMLRGFGYTVKVSKTAEEALKLCEEHPFDLAILDFIMPSMNAIELLTRIRKRIPLIRSIIVSGKIADEIPESDVRHAFKQAVEADASLKKPLLDQQLRDCINDLLDLNPSKQTWKDIATRSIESRKATIKKAKALSLELKKRLSRPRKKK